MVDAVDVPKSSVHTVVSGPYANFCTVIGFEVTVEGETQPVAVISTVTISPLLNELAAGE